MDMREQRGLQIAKTSRIRKNSNYWVVPSQSGKGTYKVRENGHGMTCNCPDCELRRTKCKHIWAVEFIVKKSVDSYGNEQLQKELKVTYTQDWTNYNKAQCNEKGMFMGLLADLCSGMDQPKYEFGRPTLSLKDMVFCSAFKVYSQYSGRRFTTDMTIAREKEYIAKVPHFNSVFNYLRREDMTPILVGLIEASSKPLASVENDFAMDSSGFSTSEFKRWYDFKYGRESNERIWLKCHINTGVKTNVITSVKITKSEASDCRQFEYLFKQTARNFNVKEQTADKAYSSRENCNIVASVGGEAIIPFRSNATGRAGGSPAWKKLYHYFEFNRDEFLQKYHKRSNVESTFNMIKSKFGKEIKSKDRTAQINEILCKVLCHNIVVLIHEMFELGISPQFCTKSRDPAQIVA